MKISEIIEQLEKYKGIRGDCEVFELHLQYGGISVIAECEGKRAIYFEGLSDTVSFTDRYKDRVTLKHGLEGGGK